MKTFMGTVLMSIVFVTLSGIAYADDIRLNFRATLTGAQEVPERDSPAEGEIRVRFDKGFTELEINLRVSENTVGVIQAAHLHCGKPGENGPVIFGFFNPGPFPVSNRVRGTLTNDNLNPGQDCVPIIGRPVNNVASLAFAMREGLIYANVHTNVFPGGEVRGQLVEVDQ